MGSSLSPHQKQKPNLKQLAQELGVSMMTVSRALNGHSAVAAHTRERVLAAAKRLKYRPNRLIRAIRSGRSNTVGVMISVRFSFDASVVHGIHDSLAQHGYLPILHFHGSHASADRDDMELEYLHRLLDQRVDGIIFWPSDATVSDVYLKEVWERGVPLVAVDRHLPRTKADFSGTNDVGGGELVAKTLLSLGHRRVAHIAGESSVATYVDRRRGFEQVISKHTDVSYTVAECAKGRCRAIARTLLDTAERPTAIFVPNDGMAPPIYSVAKSLGLKVGRDLSIVGFGDLTETKLLRPRLTTVGQNPYEIGREAARLLLDRIEGRTVSSTPISTRIMPTLILRCSMAPPPA